MTTTRYTTKGQVKYWYKFLIIAIVGLALLVTSLFLQNSYLSWGAAIVLTFSCWYAIMSIFEFFDKIDR